MAETADPIQAFIDRAKQELAAINQRVIASTATYKSLEDTLATTQKQVSDLQEQAKSSSDVVSAANAKAAEILQSATRDAAKVRADAIREIMHKRNEADAEMVAKQKEAQQKVDAMAEHVASQQQALTKIRREHEAAKHDMAELKRLAAEFSKT